MSFQRNRSSNYNIQLSVNSVLQTASNVCLAICDQNVEDIEIIIDNGSRMGDVVIEQKCDVDALCSMKTSLESISLQQLESAQEAETKNEGNSWLTWPSWGVNRSVNYNKQTMMNIITQVVDNTCQAQSSQQVRGITVYANNNSEIAGFNINQEASVNAECMMETTGSVMASQSAISDQYAKSTSGNMIATLIALVFVALIVCAYLCVNVWLKGKVAKEQSESQLKKEKDEAAALLLAKGKISGQEYIELQKINSNIEMAKNAQLKQMNQT